jgi:hypothetical protein
MIIAIFQNERVYEGNDNFLNAVYPMPGLSKVVVDQITQPGLEILGNLYPAMPPLFREDSFDPTTRIRRGRFYCWDKVAQYGVERVSHYPFAQPVGGRPASYDMNTYRSLQPAYPASASKRPLIFLGDAGYKTAWHVIGAERLFNSETQFTLKSANTLGTLPDLDEGALPPKRCKQIREEFEKVADAAYKYMSVPTVDVCREFARVILTAWLPTVGQREPHGDDLGDVIKAVPDDSVCIKSAARIINRFHPRGKSSEQERQAQRGRSLRDVSDEDGELSVSLVAFLLREFGWAR